MSGVGAADVSTMAMSLLAVVGLIIAGGYLLRRTPLGAVARQSGPLKVVATLPLGARERLVLIEARGAECLLAISPAGVFNVGRSVPGDGERGAAGAFADGHLADDRVADGRAAERLAEAQR